MHRRFFLIAPVLILILILTGCVPAIPEYMLATSGIGLTSQSAETPGSDLHDNQESLQTDENWSEKEDSSLPEPDNMQFSDDQPSHEPDNSAIILNCPVINAVPDHPGWYESMIGDIYILLFGQTDGLQSYLGKPATVLGMVIAENLGMDRLYKHLPVEVYGFSESSGNYDNKPTNESVSLTGMIELNASGNLVLHSTERGDVFIQTDHSCFGEENFQYPANFTGYLFSVTDPDCPYLLIATSYSIMDFPDVSVM